MKICKLTRHECKYAPHDPAQDECHACVELEELISNPLLTTMKNKWISCIERLPEPLQNVLICTDIDTVTVAWINGDHWTFADTGNGHTEDWSFDDVKYWMPLPEPLKMFDTRAIKPEKYAELREQDFDTWLDTILHEIIEQVNFDASEVDALGGAVWNGECPDGTPYPKQCAREDAYIQCIRQSNQLDAHSAKLELLDDRVDALKDLFEDLETQINDLSLRFEELKKYIGEQETVKEATSEHTCSNFCGNCTHYQAPTSSVTLPTCKLSGEIIDPDDSSCAMFEPPF